MLRSKPVAWTVLCDGSRLPRLPSGEASHGGADRVEETSGDARLGPAFLSLRPAWAAPRDATRESRPPESERDPHNPPSDDERACCCPFSSRARWGSLSRLAAVAADRSLVHSSNDRSYPPEIRGAIPTRRRSACYLFLFRRSLQLARDGGSLARLVRGGRLTSADHRQRRLHRPLRSARPRRSPQQQAARAPTSAPPGRRRRPPGSRIYCLPG